MKERFWQYSIVLICFTIVTLAFVQCRSAGDNNVRFGATFPLTGEVASYGQKAKRGIEMAIDEANAKAGVLGKKVSVEFQDDRNDKREAVSIMTKFATIDKLPVVFGSAGSGATLAITPLANRYKVLLVSPISSSSTLSTEGGPFFFRTVPADDQQASVLSKWVYEAGARNVAVVYTNNSWGKPLTDGFKQKFEALGGHVLIEEGVQEGGNDFRTIITKLKGTKGIDAIVSPTYPKEGGIFVKQTKELNLQLPLFGGDNWGSPEFLNIAKEAAEGVSYTAPSESTSPTYSDFASRYKVKYHEEPDVFGAYSYDAVTAVLKAVEAAGTTTPDKVREALSKTSFTGVSGEIAFQPNGDLKSEAFARKRIQDGKAIAIK